VLINEPWGRPITRRELFVAARKTGIVGSALLLTTFLQGPALAEPLAPDKKVKASIVIRWNAAFLQAVRDSRIGPP
jgi:hypothetical protein